MLYCNYFDLEKNFSACLNLPKFLHSGLKMKTYLCTSDCMIASKVLEPKHF